MRFVLHIKNCCMLFRSLVRKDPVERARKHCKRKFLYYFKKGYQDQKYLNWERQYKLEAHLQFQNELNKNAYNKLLKERAYEKIASIAVRIESKTNLLFSFEKNRSRPSLQLMLLVVIHLYYLYSNWFF